MKNSLSSTLTTSLIDGLPGGVIIFKSGGIKWVNKWLLERLQVSPDQLEGLSKIEASETPFTKLFNHDEIIQLTGSKQQTYWLQRKEVSVSDHSIHYFQDISSLMQLIEERNQLRLDLEALQTKDPVTGLLNKAAILHTLVLQVARSRRYQNPLSIIELSISSPSGEPCSPEQLHLTSNYLKDQLRWADQLGLLDEQTFLIVLPETTRANAELLVKKLYYAEGSLLAENREIVALFMVEEWAKGDDPRKLLNRLSRHKVEEATQI